MKILAILPHSIGGRLTISSVFDGFRQNSHEVFVFDELSDSNFIGFINGKSFDFIVGYDFSAIKLKVDNGLNIPSINYFSDVIESNASGVGDDWKKYSVELKREDNYTFYWDKKLTEEKNEYKNIFYMPHFVNCDIYKNLEFSKEYDIMFAGRLDTDYRSDMFIDLMLSFPDYKFAWFAIEKHFEDVINRTDEKDLIKKAYKGFIDNETDMAVALNKSKIVFNMNSQGKSSLNYRTMQTMACKTLLISDYREELNMFKGIVPFYGNTEDLILKIKYYMENPQAYENTTKTCQNEIITNYNSKKCVEKMLEVICKKS